MLAALSRLSWLRCEERCVIATLAIPATGTVTPVVAVLWDEQSLLAAMAYVDLNPIRAGMNETLEHSAHTAIAARLAELQGRALSPEPAAVTSAMRVVSPTTGKDEPADSCTDMQQAWLGLRPEEVLSALPEAPLMPFDPTGQFEQAVPFGLEEYLDLVDTMGRTLHPGKRGVIEASSPPLLRRLGMDAEAFMASANHFFKNFATAVGTPAKLIALAAHRQQLCLRGLAAARRMWGVRGVLVRYYDYDRSGSGRNRRTASAEAKP